MSIKVEHDGQEIEVLTPDELAVITGEKTELQTKLDAALEEIKKKDNVISEKNTNFKKYKDMSEEEKAKFSAGELEAKRQAEEATEIVSALKKQIDDENVNRFNNAKEKAIRTRTGDNKDLYEKVLKNWDLINLTGTDDAVINQRVGLAFTMATGGRAPNPLNAPLNGDMSGYVERNRTKGFADTDEGKAALDMIGDVEAGLGIPKEDKK